MWPHWLVLIVAQHVARSSHGATPPPPGPLMPDCGVHYLWFAFVCFLIRSPPPPPGQLGLFAKHSPTSLSVLTAERVPENTSPPSPQPAQPGCYPPRADS